jgi:hypothetical protein
MHIAPISLNRLVWEYHTTYRVVGLTGKALGFNGLTDIGNTSVQMGVHTAFLSLISLSFIIKTRKPIFHFIFILMIIATLLTYSRSGLIVLMFGLIYFFVDQFKKNDFFILFYFLLFLSIFLAFSLDSLSFLSKFGTLGKISMSKNFLDHSSADRIKYISWAFTYLLNHPWAFFTGTGYGEQYTQDLIGTPHLESLLLTTLFQSGCFAFLALIYFFYLIYKITTKYGNLFSGNFYNVILYAIKLYIPGLTFANLVGGNSLQTDFMAPFFYFVLAISIVKCSKLTKLE